MAFRRFYDMYNIQTITIKEAQFLFIILGRV